MRPARSAVLFTHCLLALPLTSSRILRAPLALPLVLAHALARTLINVHTSLRAQNSLAQSLT